MKNIIALACTVLFFSCNQSGSNKEPVTKNDPQTTTVADNPEKGTDVVVIKKNDTASLIKMANEILMAAKTRDYQKFASFIHPEKGVRFSPFSHIDTAVDKRFSGNELITLAKQKKKINWGSGYAETEKLTADQYFAQCVYDADYLTIGKISVNKINRGGTAEMINVLDVYPGHDIVEFFIPGKDKAAEGMDWSAVRLIFEMKDDMPYLVAVVYDHWTP